MDADAFIQTEGLTRVYSSGPVEVTALRDVTLSVDRGCFVGVTGASGSGKSGVFRTWTTMSWLFFAAPPSA